MLFMGDNKAVATLSQVYSFWTSPHSPLPVAPRTTKKEYAHRAYSFCLSDLSAERKVLFFLTRRGHVISPRQIEQTGEAVRTAPTSPPAGHVAIGEFPVT